MACPHSESVRTAACDLRCPLCMEAEIERLQGVIVAYRDGAARRELEAEVKRLQAAMRALIADIEEYERINNLAPNPGKPDCWQSVTRAKAALQ
jgi:organic radical activating enzyme